MLAFIASVIATIGLVGAALAQKRVALVIGNSAYKYAGELPNPKNDAADISAVFRKLGFQVVDGIDLDKTAFDRKVRDFATALQGAEVGVFFYAGHGMQVGGQNYLVPIDAELSSEAALDFEMVRLDLVHRSMERETQTNIIFLDACRNNPLERSLRRAMGTRSAAIGRGLAAVESGIGSLISFSTQPGNVAADGTGPNSPFASALVRHLSDPDDLGAILIAVRNDVMQATQRQQVPWEHSALTGRFYFSRTVASDPVKVGPGRQSEAAEAWAAVKDSTNVAVLAAYIARYKETFYAELARARIEELNKQQFAVAKTEPEQKIKRPEPVEQKTALVETPTQKALSPTRPPKPLTVDEERSLKPKDAFQECDDCPAMVVVPPGEFLMGSPETEESRDAGEGPQHRVTIAKPFAVGKFELTFAEWDVCVAVGQCKHKPGDEGWGRGKRPVINVSWDDITREYLPWLQRKTGKAYRLLTDPEWEYAARAGTKTPFATGATISTIQANYDGTTAYGNGKKGLYRQRTVEVGVFAASPFGLNDMHGNVWEWVQECYGYSGPSTDGAAVTFGDCTRRILRGGSWSSAPQDLRSASRDKITPDTRNRYIGFRVARTLSP
jgi:formylglycine-generating enzyme required for sulfatase activity